MSIFDSFSALNIGASLPLAHGVVVGARERSTRRFVVLKRAAQRHVVLFEVFRDHTHAVVALTNQPFLEDHVVQLLVDDAVTVLDVVTTTDFSDSQGALDELSMHATVDTVLPVGPNDNATDVYGNHLLVNEDWDDLAVHGGRQRIISRARAVARRLGLAQHMSDDALYEALYNKRERRNPDNARRLALNRAVHAALSAQPLLQGLQHTDFTLHRSDYGIRSVRSMQVRVYSLPPNLLVATELRDASSAGDARALWACSALNVTRQAERLAVLYASPLPFIECFLQEVSPPLVNFARTLLSFPWMPLDTTCRACIGFFDWRRNTAGLDVRAMLTEWLALTAAERAAIVHRRVREAEARARRRVREAARGGDGGAGAAAAAAESTSGDTVTDPATTGDEGEEEEDEDEEEEEDEDEEYVSDSFSDREWLPRRRLR